MFHSSHLVFLPGETTRKSANEKGFSVRQPTRAECRCARRYSKYGPRSDSSSKASWANDRPYVTDKGTGTERLLTCTRAQSWQWLSRDPNPDRPGPQCFSPLRSHSLSPAQLPSLISRCCLNPRVGTAGVAHSTEQIVASGTRDRPAADTSGHLCDSRGAVSWCSTLR